jgi:hypothetical protein
MVFTLFSNSAEKYRAIGARNAGCKGSQFARAADRARGSGPACHKRRLAAPDGNWQVISGRSTPESLIFLVVNTHEASPLAIRSEL